MPIVLVVEDEPLLLMMALDTVEEAGFSAIAARNADEAIAILEGHDDISVVFSDIDMPGSMNGLDLIAAVYDRWPPVKLILTSGHRLPDRRMMPEGCMFFGKPYDTTRLIDEMRRMVH